MLCPDRQKNVLRLADQHVGQFPGDLTVVEPLVNPPGDFLVESTCGHQVGHDDRVRRGAGRAGSPIASTSLGSIESSQSFVPVASKDSMGFGIAIALGWVTDWGQTQL